MAVRVGLLAMVLSASALACGSPAEGSGEPEAIVEPGFDGPLGKADSASGEVELKVTLRPDQIGMAQKKLGLRDSVAARREIWFYDTGDLDLFQSGLILRGRDKHGEPDDSTVKLRPMSKDDVADEWFALAGFKCEEDRSLSKSVTSCSLTSLQQEGELDAIADGERDPDKAFSSAQEDMIDTYSGLALDWGALLPLGPVDARVWKVKPHGFAGSLTLELWELPDSSRLLEVSLRASPAQADEKLALLVDYLASRGFDTSEQQETKTRAALELFAAQP